MGANKIEISETMLQAGVRALAGYHDGPDQTWGADRWVTKVYKAMEKVRMASARKEGTQWVQKRKSKSRKKC